MDSRDSWLWDSLKASLFAFIRNPPLVEALPLPTRDLKKEVCLETIEAVQFRPLPRAGSVFHGLYHHQFLADSLSFSTPLLIFPALYEC